MSPNTLRAYGYDLRYLFTFLAREDLDYREFRPPDALRPLGFAQPQDCAAARSDGGVGRGGPAGRLLSPATVNRILRRCPAFTTGRYSPRNTTARRPARASQGTHVKESPVILDAMTSLGDPSWVHSRTDPCQLRGTRWRVVLADGHGDQIDGPVQGSGAPSAVSGYRHTQQ